MKKKLLLRLCLILTVLLSLYSCTNEDLYSSSENEKQEVASKSLWKEDMVYINNVKESFLQHADLTGFKEKYGDIQWEYAMTFDKFDESYLMAPLLKNGTVWSVAIVERKGEKIYFSYSTDKDAKEFFSSLIFKKEKAVYRAEKLPADIAARTECTTRIYHLCFENLDGSQDCYPKPVTKCIQKNDYLETESDGGTGDGGLPYGGGTGYQGTPTDSTKTPCAKMKAQNTNTEYKAKIESLDKNSVLSQKKETGYSENKSGTFKDLPQATSTDNSDGLKVPDSPDTKGYIHTHLNDYETGKTDANGNPEIKIPIRMFSPADVNTLMVLAGHVTDGDYSALYGTMVSSDGNYTIKFTGTATNIKTGFKGETWRNRYRDYVKNESGSLEKKFLSFLRDEMGVSGVSLYKIKSNGTIQEKALNINNKVRTTDCPN